MRQGAFQAWTDCVKKDESGILATVLGADTNINVNTGSRLFIAEGGYRVGSLGARELDEKVVSFAKDKLREIDPTSETHTFDLQVGHVTVFIDVHIPAAEVMIFGAGHDAIPVAIIARQCGFRVTVVDRREAFATPERFPGTSIVLARPEQFVNKVHPGRRTFIVIMNHHLDRDRECLRFALQSEAPYVGLLGPKKRCQRLLKSLQEQGTTFSKETLSRLYNPVGLDIGAEGSEEIAVSIISEIVACKHGRMGGHLRERDASLSIHERAEMR